LDDLFSYSRLARRDSLISADDDLRDVERQIRAESGMNGHLDVDIEMGEADANVPMPDASPKPAPLTNGASIKHTIGAVPLSPNSNAKVPNDSGDASPPRDSETALSANNPAPLSPPSSSDGTALNFLSNGGIPWYLEPFDPAGTSVSEERWTGQDVMRDMSEELSDLDDEIMQGLEADESLHSLTSPFKNGSGSTKSTKKGKSKRRR